MKQSSKEEKESAQGTVFAHVLIEVKDAVKGKTVQDGSWYHVTVKEDPSGYLKAEEQITVFVPAHSSIALVQGKTFEVDITTSIRLRALVPKDYLYVSESGIRSGEDIRALYENGTDAVLIGETLMRAPDKKAALLKLKGGVYD